MFFITHHIFHNLPRIYIDHDFNNNIYSLVSQYKSLPICYQGMIICITNGVMTGLYYGVTEFSNSVVPLSNFIQNLFNGTIIGVLDAIVWPISIPYMICKNMDYLNIYMKKVLYINKVDYRKSSIFMNLVRFMYYVFH